MDTESYRFELWRYGFIGNKAVPANGQKVPAVEIGCPPMPYSCHGSYRP